VKYFIFILLSLLVFAGCSKVKEPEELKQGYIVVVGVSMNPTIYEGDILQIVPTPYEELQVGDVIAWEHRGSLIGHRIVEITDYGIYTKGDNPKSRRDPFPITRISYRGQVIIPHENS
jgi:signal peptidase I